MYGHARATIRALGRDCRTLPMPVLKSVCRWLVDIPHVAALDAFEIQEVSGASGDANVLGGVAGSAWGGFGRRAGLRRSNTVGGTTAPVVGRDTLLSFLLITPTGSPRKLFRLYPGLNTETLRARRAESRPLG